MRPKSIPVWMLKYQKDNVNGYIHQDGMISCNGEKIQILGYRIKKLKKTFFLRGMVRYVI